MGYYFNIPFFIKYLMAQIPKYYLGGKNSSSPKSLEEYNKKKQEYKDIYDQNELNKEKTTVLVNGKRYSIKDASEKLNEWVGSSDSRDLVSSYGKKGSSVNSAYNNFLSLLKSGGIKEINTTPQGFNIVYDSSDIQSINLGNKYNSDYLSKAIDNTFSGLNEYNNQLQTPDQIDISYNPEQMIKDVWGGKINQEVYNRKSTSEKIDDVIKAFENNRNRYYEYLNSEDKTPFKGFENIPFKSIEEYDNFIDALSKGKDENPNSEFDWEEQKNYQHFGDYIWKYIFGKQEDNQSNQNNQSDIDQNNLDSEEDEIRKINGLPKNAPLIMNFNGKDIYATKDGLRELDKNTGTLKPLRGYYNFQANPNTYHLKTGWYDTNYIPFDKLQDYLNNNLSFLNDVYNPEIYKWRKNSENIKFKDNWEKEETYNDYYKLAKLLNIKEGDQYGIDYLSPYIVDNSANDRYEFVGINNKENIDSYLNKGMPYKSTVVYAIDKQTGDIIPGEFGYNQGYLQFNPNTEYENFNTPINLNKLSSDIINGRNSILDSKFIKDLYNKYFKLDSTPKVERSNNIYVPGIISYKLQEGGIIRNTMSTELNDKKAASLKDVFNGESLSAADKADLTSLALDITGLISTAAVGVGNAVGATTGLGSTISTAIADYKRDNDWSWRDTGNLLLNLGMDAATLVPGLGSIAKSAKVVKKIKNIAPILRTIFTTVGLGSSASAVMKAASGEEMSINDWRLIVNGLNAVTGVGRKAAGKKLYTKKGGELNDANPLTVKTKDGKSYEVIFKNNEVENFNNLSKENKLLKIKDKLKSSGLSQEEIDKIELPKKLWYNPLTYRRKIEAKETKSGREFKDEVIKNIKEGKYNKFQRSLIAEQALYGKKSLRKGLEDNNIEITNKYGIPSVRYNNPENNKDLNIKGLLPKTTTSKESNKVNKINETDEINKTIVSKPLLLNSTKEPLLLNPKSTKSELRKLETYRWRNSEEGKKILSENKRKQDEALAKRRIAYAKGLETKKKKELGIIEGINTTKISKGVSEPISNINKKIDDILLNALIKDEEFKNMKKLENLIPYQAKSKHSSKPKKSPKKVGKDVPNRINKHNEGGKINYIEIRNNLIRNRDKYEIGSKEWIDINKIIKEFKNGGILKLQEGGNKILDEVIVKGKYNKLNPDFDLSIKNTNKLNYDLKPIQKSELTKSISNEDQNNLKNKNIDLSIPLSTLSSTISAINKSKANDKIYNTLKSKLKPSLINLPTDLHYTIQGNEGAKQAYYRQASNLEGSTRKPIISDIDKQLAYNLDVARAASDARLQGDLTNEQAFQQSREKAFQVMSNNLLRREDVANKNKLSIVQYLNTLANLKAQKIAQNSNIWDTYLHDITEQVKQYGNIMNQKNVNNQILDTQYKNANKSIDNSIKSSELDRKLEALRIKYKDNPNEIFNDPEYNNIIQQQKNIKMNEYKNSLNLQKLSLKGSAPIIFKLGGCLNKK